MDGEKLIQRADDKEETVRSRLKAYHANTVDVIDLAHPDSPLRMRVGYGRFGWGREERRIAEERRRPRAHAGRETSVGGVGDASREVADYGSERGRDRSGRRRVAGCL